MVFSIFSCPADWSFRDNFMLYTNMTTSAATPPSTAPNVAPAAICSPEYPQWNSTKAKIMPVATRTICSITCETPPAIMIFRPCK
ncbi:hypothetical protein D3C81_1623830 [compost metagenome]